MTYTEAQRLTLKSFIQNDPTLGPKAAAGDYDGVANGLNATAAGPYVVWCSSATAEAVAAKVSLAAYTPTDNPPASAGNTQGTNDALLFNNRALACQLKQANVLAIAFQSNRPVVCAKPGVRQAVNDCLTAIPSGASGAATDAGWAGAAGVRQAVFQRNATLAEKVLASGTGTTATPADLGVVIAATNTYAEGAVGPSDVGAILA